MKVFGKKIQITDCTWELEDSLDLKSKLESLSDDDFIEFCFENGKFEEGHNHHPKFEINYLGEIGEEI